MTKTRTSAIFSRGSCIIIVADDEMSYRAFFSHLLVASRQCHNQIRVSLWHATGDYVCQKPFLVKCTTSKYTSLLGRSERGTRMTMYYASMIDAMSAVIKTRCQFLTSLMLTPPRCFPKTFLFFEQIKEFTEFWS